jgi:hypothetical protein
MQKYILHKEVDKIDINSIVSFFRKKIYLVALLFCLIVGAIYFSCAERITKNVFAPTDSDYYTYLLDAFFHGRTDVPLAGRLDLSLFENKWYLYWGPAPVLLILPFYLLSHLQASDILYTAIGGTINVALFYGVIQAFKKCFRISLSLMAEALLVLSFGLASPNFFLSLVGGIWHTQQILATTYLLLFYLLYFRFLESKKHWQLILSAVFFCLACLSRYTFVFHGILFVYVFVHGKKSGRAIPPKTILYIALLMLAFVSLETFYNFVRFHDALETGLRFQVAAPRFAAVTKSNEILSPRYVLYNVYYCFINSVRFSLNDGLLVRIDDEGNSILSVYPVLLLLPLLFYTRTYVDKKRLSFLLLAGIVIGLNLLVLLFYFATGWKQFGYRYFFDVIPLLFLLLMFILPVVPMPIQIGLLAYGVFVNFYGIMEVYGQIPSFEEALFWAVCVAAILAFLSAERLEGT